MIVAASVADCNYNASLCMNALTIQLMYLKSMYINWGIMHIHVDFISTFNHGYDYVLVFVLAGLLL